MLLSPFAKVPKPIAWNRHAIVMEYISGVELAELRDNDLTEEEPRRYSERSWTNTRR